MDAKRISDSIAYCGLICALCGFENCKGCKSGGGCEKRLSTEGCFQHSCCSEKGISGCWECPSAPCGKDMLSESHVKTRAFVKMVAKDGIEAFSAYIINNLNSGVIYHKSGINGDYDLENEDAVLKLLQTGKR